MAGNVRIEVSPVLAGLIGGDGSDWMRLEKEITEETTVGDILTDFSLAYTDFRRLLFEPQKARLSGRALAVLNGNLLKSTEVVNVKVKDGDTLVLIPIYQGG